MLKGKKIILGVTGSIAAYKAVLLTRLLIKSGAEVKVIMTPAASSFVSPLTFGTISKNKVLTNLFSESEWENHAMLGRWADVMLIAPLSCNTLAKMANGLCDNMLLSTYLSATCPVIVAPAMDEDMWKHPSTISNLKKISDFGNIVLDVNDGELASGLTGPGRMAEPEEIVDHIHNYFLQQTKLSGKRIMVTAGPTYESIDPVRFIGNHSSGKMGLAIAEEAYRMGAEVDLIIGPNSLDLPGYINIHRVTSAEDMLNASLALFPLADIAIMSAAVADYTPVVKAEQKIKKSEEKFTIGLKKTTDILKTLGQKKKHSQTLVGFALETTNEKSYALGKLESKNADIIILNSLRDSGAGFRGNTNKITIFDRRGEETIFDLKPKSEVAKDILDAIVKYRNE